MCGGKTVCVGERGCVWGKEGVCGGNGVYGRTIKSDVRMRETDTIEMGREVARDFHDVNVESNCKGKLESFVSFASPSFKESGKVSTDPGRL
jgi:hypothetical protein